jgi:hypothetical protein
VKDPVSSIVIPAKAGIDRYRTLFDRMCRRPWIPAFAGMTKVGWATLRKDLRTRRQTEKLEPQPQPEAAFGLVTRKEAPPSDST